MSGEAPVPPEAVDVLVVGAGPTGLGAASRLMQHGHPDWALIDAFPEAGGLGAFSRAVLPIIAMPSAFLYCIECGNVLFTLVSLGSLLKPRSGWFRLHLCV